jgi:hypothetical protein
VTVPLTVITTALLILKPVVVVVEEDKVRPATVAVVSAVTATAALTISASVAAGLNPFPLPGSVPAHPVNVAPVLHVPEAVALQVADALDAPAKKINPTTKRTAENFIEFRKKFFIII